MSDVMHQLDGGLIVSCQAPEGSPMRDTETMGRVAQAALMGGARGIRVNGAADVATVRALYSGPVIGLHKVHNGSRYAITPAFEHAEALVVAGADIVALEATAESQWDTAALIARVRSELGVVVMADVSSLAEGLAARDAGAEIVGTTLSGYTADTAGAAGPDGGPDLDLVAALAEAGVRTIAEGRYTDPADVVRAFDAGAFAVVVGSAITDPLASTRRFVRAISGPDA